MPTFDFLAKAEDGRSVKGEIEAGSEMEARVRLRAQKLRPMKIESKRKSKQPDKKSGGFMAFGDSVSNKDLSVFTRQFAVLVSAGVPIVQSIDAMSKGARSQGLTNVLLGVMSDVEKGKRLADALANRPTVFTR